jgi:hypothetical protein
VKTIIPSKNLPFLMIVLGVLTFGTGCQTTLKTKYNPTYSTTYPVTRNVPMVIASVSDKRAGDPAVYYKFQNDTGRYDQPVADLVQEALAVECQRSGFVLSQPNGAAAEVRCEVLDFKASVTPPALFRSGTVDLTVVVVFEWRDTGTGKVLTRNEQSERRSHNLGNQTPQLPFAEPMIHDYGQELLNDMLPRVIEKELCSLPQTQTILSGPQPEPTGVSLSELKVVSYKYDDKTQRGSLSVDITGRGIEVREWVLKNIGEICSSKELLLEAGQEPRRGGHYRVLNESVKDGILTIEFTAGFGGQ